MEVDGGAGPPSRSAHEALSDIRVGMEEVAAKLLFLKKEGRSKSELRELVTQMSLLFIALRQANRSILLEEDRVKVDTEKAKAPVDFTTLQLHNLIYEKNHYLKAIKACKDFRSKYPDIDLVPEEEFFRDAPEDIKRNVLSSDGQQDLMLKRLHYELFQRKELCKLREKLELHKKGLVDTIAARKKFLSGLPSHLKTLKKASLSVQQQLGMQHTKKLKQHRAAELLPPPLYIVYSQFLAQKEAFEEKIELEIIGSIKDAQSFALQPKNDNGINMNVDNNRMDDDTPDDEDDSQSRRKRPKKVANRDKLEHAGVYEPHPLNILLHVYDDEKSDVASKLLTLRFQYLVKLRVVCVGVEGADGNAKNILSNLFPNDTGVQLPHQMAKLYAGDSLVFDEKRPTRPYKWAQHLAGMDFLPELSPLYTSDGSSKNETLNDNSILSGLSLYRHQNRVETLLQRIRSRKKAQMALVKQLDSMMKLKWPTLTYSNVPWALHSPVCVLEQFAPIASDADAISPVAAATEQIMDVMNPNGEERGMPMKVEIENSREDGELPSASQFPPTLDVSKIAALKGSFDPEHLRSLALIAKSSTPRMGKSLSFGHNFDELELLLEAESDTEKTYTMQEEEDAHTVPNACVDNLWEDFAAREYQIILTGEDKGRNVKLQAQIKVSMEYPLRPPCFTLALFDDISKPLSTICGNGLSHWYNELRAIEAEVNLHILRMLPCEEENNTLAHQVCLLAMLFDFHVNQAGEACPGTATGSSVLDVGLCKPVMGKMIARSFRGRDRRRMFSWKDVGCTPGFPY